MHVLAVLEAFLRLIPRELISSNIVKLFDFETFRISINIEGAEKFEDLSKLNIKKPNLLFRPGKEFSGLTGTVKYSKI